MGGCFKPFSCLEVGKFQLGWAQGGVRHIRSSLDNSRVFLMFCIVCTASGHDLFGEDRECINWKWIDTIYSQHFKLKLESISILYNCPGFTTVCCTYLNRRYICDLYFLASRESRASFSCWKSFLHACCVGSRLPRLRNRRVSFAEPWVRLYTANLLRFSTWFRTNTMGTTF